MVQRPAIRLVGMRGRIGVSRLGQRGDLGRHGDQPGRQRQRLLQFHQLAQVSLERDARGAESGLTHHIGGDVRVPVPVAADPRAGTQHRARQQLDTRPARAQRGAHFGVDRRDHVEQGEVVVAQTHRDLVLDAQAGQADQRGAPQAQHLAADPQFEVGPLTLVLGVAQAQAHQLGDPGLRVEHGAAARFGRVRGDHRRHQRVGQQLRDPRAVECRRVQFAVGGRQRRVLWRFARRLVRGAATVALDVLGQIGQQHEVAERADERQGDRDVHTVEHLRDGAALDLLAAYPERLDAHPLDEVEDLRTLVVANGVAQYAAEETDVVAQRPDGVLFDLAHRFAHDQTVLPSGPRGYATRPTPAAGGSAEEFGEAQVVAPRVAEPAVAYAVRLRDRLLRHLDACVAQPGEGGVHGIGGEDQCALRAAGQPRPRRRAGRLVGHHLGGFQDELDARLLRRADGHPAPTGERHVGPYLEADDVAVELQGLVLVTDQYGDVGEGEIRAVAHDGAPCLRQGRATVQTTSTRRIHRRRGSHFRRAPRSGASTRAALSPRYGR
jgi:hypothetical protein